VAVTWVAIVFGEGDGDFFAGAEGRGGDGVAVEGNFGGVVELDGLFFDLAGVVGDGDDEVLFLFVFLGSRRLCR